MSSFYVAPKCGLGWMLMVSPFATAMVFREYSKDVKLVAVKMCLCGLNLCEINAQLDMDISRDSP
jgi:hypothetical protein